MERLAQGFLLSQGGRTDAKALNVWMTPYFGDNNPYLRLLSNGLAREHVVVKLLRAHDFQRFLREGAPAPDVVHLHWQHPFLAARSGSWMKRILRSLVFLAGCHRLRRRGVRFVWTIHNLVNHEQVGLWLETYASRVLARIVDSVLVHCSEVVPQVSRHLWIRPEKCRVVPHGHYRNWYAPAPAREEARKGLELGAESLIFLYFGLIRRYKGLNRLMEAFDEVSPREAELLIIGKPKSPRLANRLEEWASERVHVRLELERIADPRLVQYIAASDVVVLPFTSSLTSGSAILAASLSRPLIAPRSGCLCAFPSDAGLFYSQDDPHGLRNAISAARSSPLTEMGHSAARHVLEFRWSDVAGQTARVYTEIFGEQPN